MKYAKSLVAAVGAAATYLVSAFPNSPVAHWAGIAVAVLTAAGVFAVPNKTAQQGAAPTDKFGAFTGASDSGNADIGLLLLIWCSVALLLLLLGITFR